MSADIDEPRTDKAEHLFSWRTEVYAWGVVGLLVVAFSFAMIDRMILTLLVGPLKADFGLTDTQISLLHGLAFTLLYVIVGIPMGWLTDRYSRRWIAGVSVVSWSIMTAMCGAANNFVQLFLARMGVGIGEAGISPAANSMIADYFPASKVALPLTLYSIGASGGIGLALIFGGVIVDYVSTLAPMSLPLVGEVYGWQVSFFVAGLPGILVGVLFVLVKEPPRQGKAARNEEGHLTLRSTFRLLKDQARFLVPHFCAAAACALVILSIHAWMPTYLIRTYDLSAGEAGTRYGTAVLIGGISGLVASGWIANRLAENGYPDAAIRVALGCTLLAIIPAIAAPVAGSIILTLLLAGVAVFGFAASIALAPVAFPVVIPNEMRGQVYALYLLTISVLGYAIGPVLVAMITDTIFKDDAAIGRSMSVVALIAGPPAAICWMAARRQFNSLITR